ncbi:MAG: SCO family protein [Gammaproteobacteria bacterium]|nr:SCO family protein [Gammaproteobacteria bacterium]MCY4217759.1 SCO family protein [Gammaproteobacteria bacterium]MCY4274612.1 SCO family protein [Gammaproteobacteria bacterium]
MFINFRLIALGAAALAAGIYLQLFGFNLPVRYADKAPEIENFFWPDQKALSEFQMVSTDGSPFGIENLDSKWNFVFFGYTHCPDICPITMNLLRESRDLLQEKISIDTDSFNFLFVSVDGERDTPEHLRRYIEYYGNNFIAATGNKDQVDSLTGQLGVPYSIDEHKPGDRNYLVAHSGSIFLISPDNKLASIYHPPHDREKLVSRFLEILEFYSKAS